MCSFSRGLKKISCDVVIIWNPKSGMVLDGTEFRVKLQHYTGSVYRKWIVESTGYYKFYIVIVGSQ